MNKKLKEFNKAIKDIEKNINNITKMISNVKAEIRLEEEKNTDSVVSGKEIEVSRLIELKEELRVLEEIKRVYQKTLKENPKINKMANDVLLEYKERVLPKYSKMMKKQPEELKELEAEYQSRKKKLERKHRKERKEFINKYMANRIKTLDYTDDQVPKHIKINLKERVRNNYY